MAFWELSTCRQHGMGAGPIPWLAVREYCKYMEIEGEQMDDMFFLIRKMDDEYLAISAEKNKTQGA